MNISTALKRYLYIVLLINLSAYNAFAQASIDKKIFKEMYRVGYREYNAQDTSRRYKPEVSRKSALFFRPVEIDIWYPAKINKNATPLPFHYFVSLFEKRADSFQDSVKYNGLTDELMRHFTLAGNTDENNIHVSLKTKSHLNVEEINGPFPLIIYMCSFNGMSYENVPLFENLASHGYIVASISSIGRYPGNMTTKYPDVLEQVYDSDYAIRFLHNKNIDTARIGVIGYSYGGLAATLLGMQNKSIQAILSLDGSEMHYYGREEGDDKDFNILRKSKYFDHSALQCPYAYLESDHKGDDGAADSVYHLQKSVGIKNYYTRLNNSDHEDFSCVSNLSSDNNPLYKLVNELSLDYFDQYLGRKKSSFDTKLASVLISKKGALEFALSGTKTTGTAGPVTLKGRIIAAGSGNAIPYVSIGILLGNCGTVSNGAGKFSLSVDGTLVNAIIRISSLGYKPKSFTVKELLSLLSDKPVITLDEQNNELNEVNIIAKKARVRTIGNTSKSKFFSVGFGLKDLGSEVGIKVSLGKKMVLLRSFNFNISQTRVDSCTFRLNIYALKDGMPSENLLSQNILIAIGNKPGAYKIDLTPYKLLLNGKVFVSLEWIAGKNTTAHGAVFFSAGLLASSYHRKTTEAKWVALKGVGTGFNLRVQESE